MKFENAFKSGKAAIPANLEARAVIVRMAQQLGVGQFASQLCPQCDGGPSKERSLSMDVGTNGVIKFYCHRGTCEFQGNAYSTPGLSVHERPQFDTVSHLNPLDADLYPLSENELVYFEERYHIGRVRANKSIRRTNHRYALAVFGPTGICRGWITRRPYSDSPADTEASRADSHFGVKVLTYMEKDEPVLSWYRNDFDDPPYLGVYLVEDQLSAMRLLAYFESEYGEQYTASVAALMGTGINASKVAEIQRVAGDSRVHIALDKDATGAAFAMARKWGQAFNECRVVVLDKDIKDCTDDEVAQLPL